MECKACELEAYKPPDMDAFRPPALNHTCRHKGPKTKREAFKALEKAANNLHHSFSTMMPGGNYHARDEIDGLIRRLAGSAQINRFNLDYPKEV